MALQRAAADQIRGVEAHRRPPLRLGVLLHVGVEERLPALAEPLPEGVDRGRRRRVLLLELRHGRHRVAGRPRCLPALRFVRRWGVYLLASGHGGGDPMAELGAGSLEGAAAAGEPKWPATTN